MRPGAPTQVSLLATAGINITAEIVGVDTSVARVGVDTLDVSELQQFSQAELADEPGPAEAEGHLM